MSDQKPVRQSYVDGWRQYPACCAGHHAQGYLAGVAVANGDPAIMAAAAVWSGLYVAYQALTRIRKGDAAGLDVLDFMVGMGAAFALAGAEHLIRPLL